MKAKIESEHRFTVTVDAENGIAAIHRGCVRESEWNGLTAFRTPDGSKIIVRCEQDLSQILARFMGDEATASGDVVLISPSLAHTANTSHHDGAASAPSVDGVVQSPNKENENGR